MLEDRGVQDRVYEELFRKAVEKRRPLQCTFELTYRCNLNCRMCYIHMTDEQAEPFGRMRTVDEWIDMAKQIRDAGVMELVLTGGECTQYPGFAELYKSIAKMGFIITVMTNAYHYSDEVRNVFEEYPPQFMCITLYGAKNETYKKVTGGHNGFDKVIENILFFKELGSNIKITYTMTRENVRDFPKVRKIITELGINFGVDYDLTPHRYDPSLSDVNQLRLTEAQRVCILNCIDDDINSALQKSSILEKELNDFSIPHIAEGMKNSYNICNGAYSSAAILWNGDMQTCLSMAGAIACKPFEIGFEDAWEQLQKSIDILFVQPEQCATCALWSKCLRKCIARNFEGTGQLDMPDPQVCRYTWLLDRYDALRGQSNEKRVV